MTHQDVITRHQNHTTFWRKLTRSCAYTVQTNAASYCHITHRRKHRNTNADDCNEQHALPKFRPHPRTTVYRTVIHRDNELVIAQRRICAMFVL